jgi:hypothetical protein
MGAAKIAAHAEQQSWQPGQARNNFYEMKGTGSV